MQVRLVPEHEKELWQNYFESNSYAIAWQTYDWGSVLKPQYRFDFYPLAAFDNKGIRGILPLYKIKTGLNSVKLISVPYAVAGGLIADNAEAETALVQKAVELSQQYNNCQIVLKQYKKKVSGDFVVDENYYNKELDLKKGVTEIWNQLDSANKEAITRAEKDGFTLELPSQNLHEFIDLLFTFHHKSGIPCDSKKWIASLLHTGMYSFALVKLNGKVVAGTMIKEFKDTISFPFTSLAAENEVCTRAIYWLYWNIIKHYAEKGFRIFHSGRIPKTDDTYQFRLGWGGTPYEYYYQYYPNTGSAKTEYSSKRGKKRELFKKCWKRLPRPLVDLAGPVIVARFP